MDVVFLLVGLAGGFAIGFLLLKSRHSSEKAQLEERSRNLDEDLKEEKKNSRENNEKLAKLNSDYSALQADYKNLQVRMQEQKNELNELQEKFSKEFENLANRIFDEKSSRFTQQNKENIAEILTPLSEKIKEFEQKVEDKHNKDTEARAGLVQQIKQLHELNQQMSKDANNLTKALRGDQKTQGNWGEFILESVLEKSGLVKDREYKIQESLKNESGSRLRPDVIVYLPDEKNVVIDSKVSLTAYEQYVSAEDDNERTRFVNDHMKSVRAHIKGLSQKSYQNLEELNSPDFVLMFIPIEPAFAVAVQHDPMIFQDAFEMNIVIVSPSTLLATLRTIANIWRQENQNRNAIEIARQGGALYDKFVGFVDDLLSIGNKIDSAKASYVDAMKKLSEGTGNLIRRTEKLKELGSKVSKSIPPNLLNRAIDE